MQKTASQLKIPMQCQILLPKNKNNNLKLRISNKFIFDRVTEITSKMSPNFNKQSFLGNFILETAKFSEFCEFKIF